MVRPAEGFDLQPRPWMMHLNQNTQEASEGGTGVAEAEGTGTRCRSIHQGRDDFQESVRNGLREILRKYLEVARDTL
jgi:hypothetical protein